MKSYWLSFLILCFVLQALAQQDTEPLVRSRAGDELNKESSSFMGDPDPLDPLPVKKENLKDDEEPVLEDIRQVLNAPSTNKEVKPKSKKAKNKNSTRIQKKTSRKSSVTSKSKNRRDDSPDTQLEKKYHQIYQRVNSSPTSVEAWAAATTTQQAQIYIVQKGDTLWTISQTLFAEASFWPKIWALNRQGITNPHQIVPGLKIYFYPGNSESAPTLAIGGESTASEQESEEAVKKRLSLSADPTAIPESLPIFRNETYFKRPAEVAVELEQLPVPADVYKNDIILSDTEITSEVVIPLAALSEQRCQENLIIKNVAFNRQPSDPYSILEFMHSVKTATGVIYAYRIVGGAFVYDAKSIKISSCATVLSTQVILVQNSQVAQLRTSKGSSQASASLIGGPDVLDQSLFTFHQYAYIDLGQRPFDVGQTVAIKSQVTDSIHGEVKIIDRFGSYAVGVITAISDTISKGDTLIPSQQ